MRDLLIHVIPSVATKWYELGVLLLNDTSTSVLDIIKADSKNDTTACCRNMFNKWLSTDKLASWDKLIKILKMIQLNTVASNVEDYLLQGK